MTRQWITGGLLAALGAATISAAVIFSSDEYIGLEPGKGGQIFLIGLGLAIIVLALFGRRIQGSAIVSGYGQVGLILLNTIVFLIFIELFVILSFDLQLAVTGAERIPQGDQLSYRGDEDWAEAYGEELTVMNNSHAVYVPYALWGFSQMQGEAINILPNGNRLTTNADCAEDSYTVYTFGGSTMWGLSVPDWLTIASFLQAKLDDALDQPVCVMNFGQMAYVSTQELILLMRELQAGRVPDFVIFYDGINEVVATEQTGPGLHRNMATFRNVWGNGSNSTHPLIQWAQRSYTYRFVEALIPEPAESPSSEPASTTQTNLETPAEGTIRAWVNNYTMVQALAESFGFDYAFFWQPVLIEENKPATDEERKLAQAPPTPLTRLYHETYAIAKEIAPDYDYMYYIADTFDTIEEPLYIDYQHLTARGNEIVAQTILDHILPRVTANQDGDR